MLVIFPVVTVVIWLLRKVMGFIQRRLGPMRTGPVGVFQTIADAIKLFHKEDIIPASADRAVFLIAPFLVFVPAVMLYVVIPFGKGGFITKDLNVGLVYLTAISSITAVGLITAGWSSDNRWALLGGVALGGAAGVYGATDDAGAAGGPPLMAGTLSWRGSSRRRRRCGSWCRRRWASDLLHCRPGRGEPPPVRPAGGGVRSWWPATTSSIAACASGSSSWASSRTGLPSACWPRCSSWAAGTCCPA